MPRYSTASDFESKGPKVAELENKLLAIRPVEVDYEARSYNEGETKTAVYADVWEIHDNGTVTELGRTAFYQQVLADTFAKVGVGNWYAGCVHRPARAWLPKNYEVGDVPAIDKAMAILDPDPEPKSAGSSRAKKPPKDEPDAEAPF